jgi:hypothetical protein
MEGEKNSGDRVDIRRLGRDQRGKTQQKQGESRDRRVAEKSGGWQVAIDEREKTNRPMDEVDDLGEDRGRESITGIENR